MRINKITIRGEKQIAPVSEKYGEDMLELKQSFLIAGTTRGHLDSYDIELNKNNLIELVFEDNTTWFCSPDTLDEVFPGAAGSKRSASGGFEIPVMLQSDESDRSVVGNILLKALNVFSKKAVNKGVRKIAEDLERKQLDNQSGLYRIDAGFNLQSFKAETTTKPYMLFLHGTSSSTKGSFGEMLNTDAWTYIQQNYGSNVIAFQHESLTKSPIQNVLELVRQLPQNAMLHVISHSRGGLIGDILARFCSSNENNRGFNATEIAYLKKAERTEDVDLSQPDQKRITE